MTYRYVVFHSGQVYSTSHPPFIEFKVGVLFEKLFCSFLNPLTSLYIYYDQYEKLWRKKFPRFISMELTAIFDFMALTKVHITLKPLLQLE